MEFPNGQRVDLTYMKERSRHAIAARLLSDAGVVKVGRQLKDGDMVLMNRQVRYVTRSVSRSSRTKDYPMKRYPVMHHSEYSRC